MKQRCHYFVTETVSEQLCWRCQCGNADNPRLGQPRNGALPTRSMQVLLVALPA